MKYPDDPNELLSMLRNGSNRAFHKIDALGIVGKLPDDWDHGSIRNAQADGDRVKKQGKHIAGLEAQIKTQLTALATIVNCTDLAGKGQDSELLSLVREHALAGLAGEKS